LVDEHDVKLVVVACNTASAAALDVLRGLLPVPVVGVIDPGVRAVAKATRNRRVGVIGTVGTISSGAYQRAIRALPVPLELACAACPGFVEFVEKGDTRSDQVAVLAERLLAPVRDAGIDALLLGCTHYPFLARTIADVMGRDVVLVASADETAFEVRAVLDRDGLGRAEDAAGALAVYSSGDVAWFRDVGGPLFGGELGDVGALSWPAAPAVIEPGAEPDATRSATHAGRGPGAASG
jgi:glutamate racemase